MSLEAMLQTEDDVVRTHNRINAFVLTLIAALSIGFVTACDNTARGLDQDATEAEAATRDERSQAPPEVARGLANDAAHAARTVGSVAADAGHEVAERASALKENVDVKAALMADAAVDASRLDVDVSAWTRTVTLNGSVATASEREKAETIARARSDGYKVVNNISVQPRR